MARKTKVEQPAQLKTPGTGEADVAMPAEDRLNEARGPDAPINAKPSMKYSDAMKALAAGKLMKPVLTEQGWVAPGGVRLRV